ncbi:hypothetical protein JCM5350_004048 [Sporobolomyces pararoseus]
MAEPSSIAPSAGYLKHALEAGRVTVICWLVLYLFDFFLTVSTERRHVWRTRWTPLKTFYFLKRVAISLDISRAVDIELIKTGYSRYVTLVAIVGNAVLVLAKFSAEYCSKICWIQPVLCALAATLCAIIAAIRVHTIFNRSRLVLFLLGLPLLIMSGVTIGLSTQVKPFVVPPEIADQLKFSGCIAVQARKRSFLVIWILPLCFDLLVLLLTIGRYVFLRRNIGAGSAVHVLMRIVNKHVLYFSVIFACNALNVGFFIFADPSLKSINVPATVALTSILTNRLVLSLFSTNSTSPVVCPTRRPSSVSSNSRRGGTWSESHSKLPSRSQTSASGGIPSPASEVREKESQLSSEDDYPDQTRPTASSRASSSRKKPSISSRSSIRTSSSAGAGSTTNTSSSGSRRRRSQDLRQQHVIVPIVPDPSRYNYYSHRHSHSSSSSAGGGVLRPLLLANSLVPPPPPPPPSNVVTQAPLPHPSMTVAPQTTLMQSLDSTVLTLSSSNNLVGGGGAALQLPGIEPSTPLTFSAAFFQPQPQTQTQSQVSSNEGEEEDERKSVQSPLAPRGTTSRSRNDSKEEEPSEEDEYYDEDEEEEEEEEFGSTGDLGEMTRENREKFKRRAQGGDAGAIASVFSSSDDGAGGSDRRVGGGGGAKSGERSSSPSAASEESIVAASSSSSSTSSKRSSAQSIGSNGGAAGDRRSISRSSLRYFTNQFPNPNEIVGSQTASLSSTRRVPDEEVEGPEKEVRVICE